MRESEKRENTADSSIRHLSGLLDLCKRLQAVNVALFEHDYNALCFGSFQLIVGQPHRRLKFVWDGKEFSAGVFVSEYSSTGAVSDWKHLKDLRLERSEKLMETVEGIVLKEFRVKLDPGNG